MTNAGTLYYLYRTKSQTIILSKAYKQAEKHISVIYIENTPYVKTFQL